MFAVRTPAGARSGKNPRMEKGVPIRSVSRSIEVLKLINRRGSVTLTDVSRAVGLAYPTTCRIVQTLLHEGLVELEPNRKRYRPTRAVQALSYGYQHEGRLIDAAHDPMAETTARVGWPMALSIGVGPSVMLCDTTYAMSALTFSPYYRGYTFPVLECAAGHVHLAYTDDASRDSLLTGLQRMGTVSVALEMFRSGKLTQRIRADGYATHDRTLRTENPGKTSSLAAPVIVGGREQAQLTLSFFSSAMTMDEAVRRYVADLLATAERIAERLRALELAAPDAAPAEAPGPA